MKKIIVLLKIIFVLIIMLIIFELFPKKMKWINIEKNTSSEKIAQLLKKEGLILHPEIFLTFSYITNSDKKLRSGTYKLSYSLTGIPIIYRLRKGSFGVKVTIPEGFTSEQIAERLEKAGVISDTIQFISFVKSNNLEGYLFPETYFFEHNQDVKNVVGKMVKEFYKRYTPDLTKRAYELKLTTHQVVVLSSIVEKEAKNIEEMKLIAGVFHNRLKKNWPLESCATVRYALKKYNQPLTYKDVKVDSPYNTYIYHGIPKMAISNPGINAIKAVLFPKETEAMFFLTKDNNTHEFSKYYEMHLENKKRKNKN